MKRSKLADIQNCEYDEAPTLRAARVPGDAALVVSASVSDDYFRTVRIPVRKGRTFNASDRAGAPPTAVISEKHGTPTYASAIVPTIVPETVPVTLRNRDSNDLATASLD